MKSLTISAILFFLPTALATSSGCKAILPPNLTPGRSTYNLTIPSKSLIGKSTERKYILHLPTNFSASNDIPTPLIFAFHGQSQPARSLESISEFSNPVFNPNAIVAYPEGMNIQPPGVQWLGDPLAPSPSTLDDRIFVSELLTHLTSTLCVDTTRVYAAGLSNGGGLAGLLMCDPTLNKRFAAFATVGGAYYPRASLNESGSGDLFGEECQPELSGKGGRRRRRIPYLNLHGLEDTVVAYDGISVPPLASVPVLKWVDKWVQKNGCVGAPAVGQLEKGTVKESRWKCGREGVVVHRAIEGFGHGWPSRREQGEPFETLRGGPTAWDATTVILEWFAGWTL